MAQAVAPTIASISRPIAMNEGELVGTGTYVRLLGQPYLLTNEHVARLQPNSGLGHLPKQDGDYHRLTNPFQGVPKPLDAALTRIEPTAFQVGDRQCVPPEYIAERFDISEHELSS